MTKTVLAAILLAAPTVACEKAVADRALMQPVARVNGAAISTGRPSASGNGPSESQRAATSATSCWPFIMGCASETA